MIPVIICGETGEQIRERDKTRFGYSAEPDRLRDMYFIYVGIYKYFFSCEDANHYCQCSSVHYCYWKNKLNQPHVLLRVSQQYHFNIRRDSTFSYSKTCGFPSAEQSQLLFQEWGLDVKKEVAHFLSFSFLAIYLCFAQDFSKIHFLFRFLSSDFLNFDGVCIFRKYIMYIDQLQFKTLF